MSSESNQELKESASMNTRLSKDSWVKKSTYDMFFLLFFGEGFGKATVSDEEVKRK